MSCDGTTGGSWHFYRNYVFNEYIFKLYYLPNKVNNLGQVGMAKKKKKKIETNIFAHANVTMGFWVVVRAL